MSVSMSTSRVATKERLLIVDDDQGVLDFLSGMLGEAGYQVLTAASGEQALMHLESDVEIDLALVDLKLPQMSGEELIHQIYRRYPDVGIAVVTANPSYESARFAVDARACGYFEKPIENLDAFRKRMEEILRARRRVMESDRRARELEQRNKELLEQSAILDRKIRVTQRNLKEQIHSQQKSREIFYTDLSRVMAIIDNMVDGIVFTDTVGKVILMNPAAGKVLEAPTFVALGKPLTAIPGNAELLGLLLAQRALELDEEGVQVEIETSHAEVGEAYYDVLTNTVHDFQGKLCGVLSVIRDVSPRKKTERLKNQFLSIVAHELRTPVTAIKAFATILYRGLRGAPPPEHLPILADMLSQSDRLGHEIDKVICLGRLDVADFAPDLQVVPAAKLIKAVVPPFEAEAKEKNLSLKVAEEAGDAAVNADVLDIRRALRALIENAVKFTPEGGEVTVRLRVENGSVVFEVSDTGIGIPEKDQSSIFEKFIQLENPLTRQFGGSGLGLSFAVAIIEAHGSRIEVESAPGEGSTFRFRLPRSESAT
jgi:PAS domain S-box-containing protein